MKILLIEDESRLAKSIQKGLQLEGYEVHIALDGQEGQKLAKSNEYDCIILDLMLPKISGLSILRFIRAKGINTPVLILTAKSTTSDKVMGLEIGADDYLCKPFAFDELIARINALIRRRNLQSDDTLNTQEKQQIIKLGDLEIDTKNYQVKIKSKIIQLSKTEYQILELLAKNKDIVISEENIKNYIQHNYKEIKEIHSNVVAVHIKNLRKKLCPYLEYDLIKTIRGFGYKISIPQDEKKI